MGDLDPDLKAGGSPRRCARCGSRTLLGWVNGWNDADAVTRELEVAVRLLLDDLPESAVGGVRPRWAQRCRKNWNVFYSGRGRRTDATHVIEFPYTRTLGPVVRPFLTGLRDGQILGIRSNDGRVLCPPLEWDPETGEALDPTTSSTVGPGGVVETWAWVTEPTAKHPLDHPFAFALIKLDGADTALMHAVDAGSIDAM